MNDTLLVSQNEKKKTRNYGIDLLRIVSMLMIVILHVLGKGGVRRSCENLTVKGEAFWALEILCYSAVNIYAIISGYVGYKSSHKGRSIISLCLQVTFYSVLITAGNTAILIIQKKPLNFVSIIKNLFPSAFGGLWYFSAYFCLFFFMPILDAIVDYVSKRKLKNAALLCILVFCCYTRIYCTVSDTRDGYSVMWLTILYILGAYISKYDPLKKWSAGLCFIGFFVCVIITSASRIVFGYATKHLFGQVSHQGLLVSYISPTIVLAAFFIVCAFIKLKLNQTATKVISLLAPMSFGVFLIHCHPLLYSYMYNKFAWISEKPILLGLLLAIAFSLAIFASCMFIDWLRILLFKVCKINALSVWIEKICGSVVDFFLKILHSNDEQQCSNEDKG